MRVVFVASANGLGHARRLLHVARSWSSPEVNIRIILTKKQRNLLAGEWQNFADKNNQNPFVIQSAIGLQGPEHEQNARDSSEVEVETVKILKDCDLVVTDNSLWPFTIRPDSILLAHFLWLDYYKIQIASGKQVSDTYRSFMSKEEEILNSNIYFAGLEPFRAFSLKNREAFISVHLPYYGVRIPPVRLSEPSILVTAGRTELLIPNLEKVRILFPNHKVTVGQTFDIPNMGYLPNLIIGRPGLGTIRDCAEFGINFSPISSEDPELASNVDVLMELYQVRDLGLCDMVSFPLEQSILREFPTLDLFVAPLTSR